jgi:sodium/bile acid cotransporter 7
MGVPLINAIYESNPMVGLYTLPLLIWHPMQLVLGSAVAPRVANYVKRKEEALGQNNNEEGEEKPETPNEVLMGDTANIHMDETGASTNPGV